MKKNILIIILGVLVIILGVFAIYNNRGDGYHLTGTFHNDESEYQAHVFIMRNKNSNLLTYYLDGNNDKVKYVQLYYYDGKEKHVFLGSHLNGYGYDKRKYKENGDYEYVSSKVIKNINSLYMDLFLNYEDLENNNVYETIKLETVKFS